MTLAVFANFRIDSNERLKRMKDSYYSFGTIKINQWVINIRGKYKKSAAKFLNQKIGKKLYLSTFETGNGWFFDSKIIAKKISSDYVFFWVEDHICTCGRKKFNQIIEEIKENNIEYFQYSWFGNGLLLKEFRNIKKKQTKYLYCLNYNTIAHKTRCKNAEQTIGEKPYILGLQGIFKKEFFFKILNSSRPFLRRWHKDTPFDFEKNANDTYILPIKFGLPKFEVFSSIDDDNKYIGSSLISRKKYPNRVTRQKMNKIREKQSKNNFNFVIKNIIKKILYFSYIKNFAKRISYHL